MKVPTPRRMSSGNYYIRLRLGGQAYNITESTEKKCIREAERIKAEYRATEAPPRRKEAITVKDAMSAYIGSLPLSTSPATLRGYDITFRKGFLSYQNQDAASVDWQKAVDEEASKYAPKTVKNRWGFMKSCLKHSGIEAPAVRLPMQQRTEHPFLEPEQMLQAIEELKGRKYEIPCLLALHGLRRSEIMALDYKDIDLKTGLIHVHGAVVQDKDNQLVKKSTNKTAASTRDVPIMIPRLREAIRETGLKSGAVWSETPQAVYRTMEDVCKVMGIPNIGAHGCRHSLASLAYSVGLSELETMELGGWSDYQTMRKIYTHLAQRDRLKAKNKIASFFEENANKNANL